VSIPFPTPTGDEGATPAKGDRIAPLKPLTSSRDKCNVQDEGSPLIFFTRPIALVFMVLAFVSIFRGLWVQMKTRAPEVALEDSEG
jgi:hypothetical protein